MKPRTFNLAIVCSLLGVLIIQLFPSPFGVVSAYSSPAQTQKRRKNGETSTSKTQTQPADDADKVKPRTDTVEDPLLEATKTLATSAKTSSLPTEAANSSPNDPPASDDNEKGKSTKKKKEPLPFDRPPASGGSSNTPTAPREATSDSTSTKSSQTQRPGVTVHPQDQTDTSMRPTQPSSSSTSQPTWERDSNANSRSTPPVLKREPDSRNSTTTDSKGDPRGAPPVLTRPTDPGRTNPSPSNVPTRPSQPSTSSTTPANDDEPIKLEGTLVNIPVLVSDRSNRYVSQLTARDFQLYEDGVQQEVAFFGNEEVPFSVALLLDMSPSVQDNQQAIQDAAVEFVKQLRPDDRVMIVSFARNVDFLTSFTSDRRILERAIRSTTTGSGTSVYEAVYRTVEEKFRNVDGRKALILISDGEDTTSRNVSYDEAVNIVTESDVLVYGLRFPGSDGNIQINPWPRNPIPRSPIPNIGIPLPMPFPWPFPRRRRGPFTSGNLLPSPNSTTTTPAAGQWPRRNRGDFMTDIANAGGGPVFDAQTIHDYRSLAFKIAEELRHVYMVSYYPSNPLSNGGFRSIRMRVKNRDDIAVRHRKGYNAKDMVRGH